MPVPSKMSDLQTLAASNSPAGSDAIGNSLDDYIRSAFAILRSTNALSSASIASGSTTDLGSSDGEAVTVTGTTTITSLGTTVSGISREVTFSGVLTITNSASIVLAGGTNYTTKAGDVLRFRSLGSGNWAQVTSSPIGFTPVQQGSGTGQSTVNLVKIGLSSTDSTKLKATVDATDFGNLARETWVSGIYAPLITPSFTGLIQSAIGTVGGTVGNSQNAFSFSGSSGNGEALNAFIYRTQTGTGAGKAAFRIQRLIDGSSQGAVQFGDDAGDQGASGLKSSSGGSFYVSGTSGNCTASGTITCTNLIATSDERKKSSIREIDARDRLPDLLKFCTWIWKVGGACDLGLIAQEVKKVAPEYVHEDEHGALGVDKASLALECVIGLASRVRALEGT